MATDAPRSSRWRWCGGSGKPHTQGRLAQHHTELEPPCGQRRVPRCLADNDYAMAAVEEVITAAKTADEIYDQYLTEAVKQ
jgi:hypothetical protein